MGLSLRNAVRGLVLALAIVMTPVPMADDLSQDKALRLRQQGLILPLEQVITLIEQRHAKSSLLDVDIEEEDGVYVYDVELVTHAGVVRELEIDAATGKILKDEEDD